jgi:hypothetical protein
MSNANILRCVIASVIAASAVYAALPSQAHSSSSAPSVSSFSYANDDTSTATVNTVIVDDARASGSVSTVSQFAYSTDDTSTETVDTVVVEDLRIAAEATGGSEKFTYAFESVSHSDVENSLLDSVKVPIDGAAFFYTIGLFDRSGALRPS